MLFKRVLISIVTRLSPLLFFRFPVCLRNFFPLLKKQPFWGGAFCQAVLLVLYQTSWEVEERFFPFICLSFSKICNNQKLGDSPAKTQFSLSTQFQWGKNHGQILARTNNISRKGAPNTEIADAKTANSYTLATIIVMVRVHKMSRFM